MIAVDLDVLDSVLLIDDDEDDAMLFEKALHECAPKIQFLHSSSYLQVFDLLNADTPPALIFMDINMPERNGFEFLQGLVKLLLLKRIPVVMFSSSGDAKNINMSYSLGASLYLRKPSHYDLLRQSLQQILSLDWQQPLLITSAHFKNGYYQPFELRRS